MMGHDPLMQFVHEQDAAFALKRAVESQRDRRVQHRRQGRPALHHGARAPRPRAGADAAVRRAPAHEGAVGDAARGLAAELPRLPALPLRRRRREGARASSASRRGSRSSARSSTSSASRPRTARPTSRGPRPNDRRTRRRPDAETRRPTTTGTARPIRACPMRRRGPIATSASSATTSTSARSDVRRASAERRTDDRARPSCASSSAASSSSARPVFPIDLRQPPAARGGVAALARARDVGPLATSSTISAATRARPRAGSGCSSSSTRSWFRVEATGLENIPATGPRAARREPRRHAAVRQRDGDARGPPRSSVRAATCARSSRTPCSTCPSSGRS